MRRGWLRPMGWTLATGAIVGLSYYGVQSVLAGPGGGTEVATAAATPYLPLPGAGSASPSTAPSGALPPGAPPSGSASASAAASTTAKPSASPTPIGAPSPSAPTVTTAPHTTPPGTPGSPPASAPGGTERAYRVDGGSVVLDIGASSATLVSQTAEPGWTAQTWQQNGWLRVDFTQGQRASAVVCSWNGHPPTVQTYNG